MGSLVYHSINMATTITCTSTTACTTTEQACHELETEYIARNPTSKKLYSRATEVLPGGNTRTVLYYDPFPIYIIKASGCTLHDADGHEYIDLLGEYTAGLYGHSEPVIIHAIHAAAQRGLSFGSHHEDEISLANLVQQRFPSMELLRFTNSGTEASLMALAAAKMYTKKSKILVFEAAYHGGVLSFSAHGASSPVNAPHEFLIARYNDLASVQQLLVDDDDDNNKANLAAILVEPMLGSGGAIPARTDFLIGLRSLANATGAVLIYDEVMTSRMYNGGGIQSLQESFRPDMTTLGKYFGGGLSFGAFGGRREIMKIFDPRIPGAVSHAGTFNNNVLTMAAGRAGLEQVFTPQRALLLHDMGEELRGKLNVLGEGTLLRVTGVGSIMCFHFTRMAAGEIMSSRDVEDVDERWNKILHLFLLRKGYYIARRGFVALSLAVKDSDLEGFVDVVREFVDTYRNLLQL